MPSFAGTRASATRVLLRPPLAPSLMGISSGTRCSSHLPWATFSCAARAHASTCSSWTLTASSPPRPRPPIRPGAGGLALATDPRHAWCGVAPRPHQGFGGSTRRSGRPNDGVRSVGECGESPRLGNGSGLPDHPAGGQGVSGGGPRRGRPSHNSLHIAGDRKHLSLHRRRCCLQFIRRRREGVDGGHTHRSRRRHLTTILAAAAVQRLLRRRLWRVAAAAWMTHFSTAALHRRHVADLAPSRGDPTAATICRCSLKAVGGEAAVHLLAAAPTAVAEAAAATAVVSFEPPRSAAA